MEECSPYIQHEQVVGVQQYIANVQGLEGACGCGSRLTSHDVCPHTQTQLSTRHQLAYLGCRVGQPTTHGNQTTVPLTCNVRRPSKVRCHSLVTSPSASPSPGTFCEQACGMPRTHARARNGHERADASELSPYSMDDAWFGAWRGTGGLRSRK